MNKILVGIGAFIFFAVVIGLLLYKVLGGTSSTTSLENNASKIDTALTERLKNTDISSPEGATYACYTWYLQYANMYPISKEVVTKNQTIFHCFTKNFISAWAASIDTADHLDPVLRAADFGTSWLLTDIEVTQISADRDSSIVNVVLGAGSTETRMIPVHVLKIEDKWKIDSVESAR